MNILRTLRHRLTTRRWQAWCLAGSFAVLGVAVLVGVRADSLASLGAEAESGVLSGLASLVGDDSASGGKAVIFGKQQRYVALGDSVASGDGINYDWTWTPKANGDGSWLRKGPANPSWEPANDSTAAVQSCHRSLKGYPYLVSASTGGSFLNLSCSGASINDGVLGNRNFSASVIGAAQVGWSKPGLAAPNPAYDAFKPTVVSVTLGMDDIGFSDFLRKCYIGTSCVTTENEQLINQRLATFKTSLQSLLTEIQSRGTASGTMPWVVLTNYYDPFHPDSAKSCGDTYIGLGNGLGANEIDWLRAKMQLMNQYIQEASTGYPKAKVADISKSLAGHTFCSADPWVYGISIWYDDFGNPAPFHPTPKGQAAIGDIVTPIIKNLR